MHNRNDSRKGIPGHPTVSAASPTAWTSTHTIEPALRSHVDTEHHAGAPVGEAGYLFQGAPGFITQGDLLAMIGPALSARGDTFLIRAYGDAVDPSTGMPLATARLEAVVQRTIEPVHPSTGAPADGNGTRLSDDSLSKSGSGSKSRIIK